MITLKYDELTSGTRVSFVFKDGEYSNIGDNILFEEGEFSKDKQCYLVTQNVKTLTALKKLIELAIKNET